MKGDEVIALQCSCGFRELGDEEIIDHLGLVFEPDDLRGNDGLIHEERARLACACGLATITTEELDAHLLEVFTPVDGIGSDGQRHQHIGDGDDS